MQERPIKYWLSQLPDGYRELALRTLRAQGVPDKRIVCTATTTTNNMTHEQEEYIKYAKQLVQKLQAELENVKQDAAQSDVDSIRALHERNELRLAYEDSQNTIRNLRTENETLVKRLVDIAAINVALEFRVIDLEKEITELRKENDRKFAIMCRLREELASFRDAMLELVYKEQWGEGAGRLRAGASAYMATVMSPTLSAAC